MVGIFITVVDDFFDAILDDGFGTLVAWKKRAVNFAALGAGVGIVDGVFFGVLGPTVFGGLLVAPVNVVLDSSGESIPSLAQKTVFLVDNYTANLTAPVLGFRSEMDSGSHPEGIPFGWF